MKLFLNALTEYLAGALLVGFLLFLPAGTLVYPMYSATIVLFFSIPLVLGSWSSFVIFLCYPFMIVRRIRNEEDVLRAELDGYSDYMERVRWRLIPYIW